MGYNGSENEVVISSHQFADAQEAEQRISVGAIDVIAPTTVSGNVPIILGLYGLGNRVDSSVGGERVAHP